MSYVYTVGLKVIVEEVLTALTETPTVYAYDFLTGDALTSPAPTITSVRTGVYRLSVTANVLTDVLFVFIPHQDDEDKIGQEALMHEKMYHVVDELANGVTLADGAITATKIASNAIANAKIADNAITWNKIAAGAIDRERIAEGAYERIADSVLIPIVEDITGFIGGFNPDMEVTGAGTAGANGIYRYAGRHEGYPKYVKGDYEIYNQDTIWNIDYQNSTIYYAFEDVPTPDLVEEWSGTGAIPTVVPNDTSLYAQLEAMRGAGWTSESLKALADAIDSIDSGLDAAGVRSAIGLASANLDTQLSGIKTDTGNIQTDTNNVVNRLTAARAGYLDKLNVSGTLANTNNANSFKADVTGLAKTTDLSGLAEKTDIPNDYAKASALATVDGKADAIKLQTDKIPNTPAVTGEYTSALTAIQADLDNPGQYKADISGLAKTTDLSGLAEKTDIPSDYAKANDLNGLAKTTDITALNNLSAAEMLNEVVVGTFTLREILTILAAKSDGYPATGGGTTTITYGGIDGTPGVIVETVDEDGNRSKVEFNL